MTTTIKEEEMYDRSTCDKLLTLAHDYVDAHAQEFDPADAGLFWGTPCATTWAAPTTWISDR